MSITNEQTLETTRANLAAAKAEVKRILNRRALFELVGEEREAARLAIQRRSAAMRYYNHARKICGFGFVVAESGQDNRRSAAAVRIANAVMGGALGKT